MSNGKTTWTLGLRKTFNLEGLSMSEVIGGLDVVESGTWEKEGFQPVIFAVIVSNGLSVILNATPENVTRIHMPFTYTMTTLFGVGKPSVADFKKRILNQVINKTINTNGRKITWDGMTKGAKIESCFSLLYGQGPVYELDNNAMTAIIPITLSISPSSYVSIQSKCNGTDLENVLVEDLVQFATDDSNNLEEFSMAILNDIITGNILLPPEPDMSSLDWPEWKD